MNPTEIITFTVSTAIGAWIKLKSKQMEAHAYNHTDCEFVYIEPATLVEPAFPTLHSDFFHGFPNRRHLAAH